MKLLVQAQATGITDEARARIAMVRPVLSGVLFSLKQARVDRLGGIEKITLEDLAREYREGHGDCGICFEYAVHDAIRTKDKLLYPRISEVLEKYCGIKGGAESILFGAEKKKKFDLIDTSAALVTDESRILAGKKGQPAKLKKHLENIKKAFNSDTHKMLLPASIRGLWKADLFLGASGVDQWVGSTLKINKTDLEGAAGLRLAIFPETKAGENAAWDESKNLILCPVPYELNFMELFYAAFYIVKQVLDADATMPKEAALPHSADRHVAAQLVARSKYSLVEVIAALAPMAQADLLQERLAGAADAETSAVAPIPATTEAAKSDFYTYGNGRFGFAVDYPANWQEPEGSVNGDGAWIRSPDGLAEIVASGWRLDGQTIKTMFERDAKDDPARQRTVTQKVLHESWYVVAGIEGDRAFYSKVIVGDRMGSFRLFYPRNRTGEFERITDHVAKSLRFQGDGEK